MKKPTWWLFITGSVLIILFFVFYFGPPDFPDSDSSSNVPPRQLRGIYELPTDGIVVCQTIRGEKLIFRAGEPVRFEQMENPAVFQVVNDNIHFLEISQRTYTTGPALTGGPLCLKASGGKRVLVRATILD
ncbi:MAG: hypothetical protein COY10_00170 [Candidatus Portnoybacteria bacterium CG_4_10_14_0_2_um_filter_43_36]|uniref:Uncharacterized protein n=3 Tax=Candidatus Portnoyibacteriota TaxID=1817913 RepID=A0A2M7YKV2_9BACT|nr:MAG: hypothetical protein COY10_00170 [Candidatus Portnoybacteria bacterium CG_4_10_14_0_2_um_filter_43_36]PJA63594.1 MAG: hypothetical protein CO160_02690 [Candidatus Portnoybacteria bacterium CG_4_9_14_3_um_filter_43_11]PJE59562.1 MAG: hypothetical protein COU84_00175 [Candidatus Portnoybacteria bacterium CG10_big_fil_rev_8_21_14_0_10_43_39]